MEEYQWQNRQLKNGYCFLRGGPLLWMVSRLVEPGILMKRTSSRVAESIAKTSRRRL